MLMLETGIKSMVCHDGIKPMIASEGPGWEAMLLENGPGIGYEFGTGETGSKLANNMGENGYRMDSFGPGFEPMMHPGENGYHMNDFGPGSEPMIGFAEQIGPSPLLVSDPWWGYSDEHGPKPLLATDPWWSYSDQHDPKFTKH